MEYGFDFYGGNAFVNLESQRMSGRGGAFQSGAGRGLNPRPERSIHAKAEDG